jgi:lysophospholipase L1-like esterase
MIGLIIGAVVLCLFILALVNFGWEHFIGPFKNLSFVRLRKHIKGNPTGQIVFYGASNFTLWKTMEKDLLPYDVANHGFGGSTDTDLMAVADEFLYPWKPRIVCFQSGSNDFAMQGLTFEQVLENKDKMFTEFHKHLPGVPFVVMSMLPLPGRKQWWETSAKVNDFLKSYCETHEDMIYADATGVMMTASGDFRPKYYSDGLHLNETGRSAWKPIILEALEKAAKPVAHEEER